MNIAQIEENVQKLLKTSNQVSFIYDLLEAYGKPKASIKRLQASGPGGYNLARNNNEVLWKKNLYFKAVADQSIYSIIDEAKKNEAVARHEPRFLTVTDFNTLLAVDTKTGETLDIPFVDLGKNFDFFLPWAGLEKTRYVAENPADVKAAEKMAKLFDLLKQDNPANDVRSVHTLNVFLSRLLFCFFAEDTEIFAKGLFTNSIASHTLDDGSDLATYLEKLFEVLNSEERSKYPQYLKSFPYVNGGLFGDRHKVPKFSRKSRSLLIECGSDLNWSHINPDIFGSMFQAVIDPDQRGNMGMHYTSVPNIMKVIEPLFLDELYEEFKKNEDNAKKLGILLRRLENIKIFDPACGSGNFLIIAYKELRKLEMEIFNRLQELSPQMGLALSGIKLSQFYGIELDDFAHEIAILSLWLAEHQMNVAFKTKFGQSNPSLPLNNGGNIKCASSNEVDWAAFCPIRKDEEIYVLGNPPYLGARTQSPKQKAEMREVLGNLDGVNSLDYIATWFYKGAEYIEKGAKGIALVSTNSITQGEQVSLLWPHILEEKGICISFAHTSFKWSNNAKNRAGVTCVIIGLSKQTNKKRKLYIDGFSTEVANISPYLTATKNIYIPKRMKPLSKLPEMVYGNQPIEGGFLILSPIERDEIIRQNPEASRFIKKLIGGNEFLKGVERWCIWIEDSELKEALHIPQIKSRIEQVKRFREEGGQVASSLVNRPHQFRYRHRTQKSFLLLPCTSSERRDYLQLGFFSADYLTTHSAQIIYDADPYIFGILSSKAHMLWTKAVGGCLESRIRYSNVLCYNNFPIPPLSEKQKDEIRNRVYEVLEKREHHPELRISDLYDPEQMPADLLAAHKRLDQTVNKCYEKSDFHDDAEQLSYLFKLYEEMTELENA